MYNTGTGFCLKVRASTEQVSCWYIRHSSSWLCLEPEASLPFRAPIPKTIGTYWRKSYSYPTEFWSNWKQKVVIWKWLKVAKWKKSVDLLILLFVLCKLLSRFYVVLLLTIFEVLTHTDKQTYTYTLKALMIQEKNIKVFNHK